MEGEFSVRLYACLGAPVKSKGVRALAPARRIRRKYEILDASVLDLGLQFRRLWYVSSLRRQRFTMRSWPLPGSIVAGLMLLANAFSAFQTSSPPSLPYAAVHDPQFIPASQTTFMNDDDRVIGLMSGKLAKAFPAGILSQHGLVEDQSPNGPIAITW
jgi:hypothetical protein